MNPTRCADCHEEFVSEQEFYYHTLTSHPPDPEPTKYDPGMDYGFAQAVMHRFDRLERKLDRLLQAVIIEGELNMADLSALAADVQSNGDAVASAVTLINGIATQLAAAATDPAAVAALAASLEANTAALAASVTANTPADPGTPVPPVVDVPPVEGDPTPTGV